MMSLRRNTTTHGNERWLQLSLLSVHSFCDVPLCHPYGICFRSLQLATSVASLTGLDLCVYDWSGFVYLSHRDNTLVEKWWCLNINPVRDDTKCDMMSLHRNTTTSATNEPWLTRSLLNLFIHSAGVHLCHPYGICFRPCNSWLPVLRP